MEPTGTSRPLRALRAVRDQTKDRGGGEKVDAGFTLVELMIVLLVMAILLAIAIPTFLGVKGNAQDRGVQSNLTTALTSAKAAYVNNGSYSTVVGLEVAALNSFEPNLVFTAGLPTGAGLNAVALNVSTDGQELLLVGWSASGTCWALVDNEGDTTAAGDAGNAIANTPTTGGDQYNHWTNGTSSTCTNAVPSSGTAGWQSHF
jgi:type IV pilus assembly protein PilA